MSIATVAEQQRYFEACVETRIWNSFPGKERLPMPRLEDFIRVPASESPSVPGRVTLTTKG